METLVSFAQENEDVTLYHILKKEGEIFWIDVGANDCEYLSITKLFYDKGNCGLNIEPQRKYIQQYMVERKRDTTLCIGVSDKTGKLKLHGTGTGATFDSMNENNQLVEEVDVLTLASICNKYVKEKVIHFLKIDVEGFEKNVLLGADFKTYRPIVIMMESTIPNTDIPNFEKWEYILLENGYIFAKQSGINRFYLANERLDLLKRFDDLIGINNIYNIYNMDKYLKQIVQMKEEITAYQRTIEDIYKSKTFKILGCVQKFFDVFKNKH